MEVREVPFSGASYYREEHTTECRHWRDIRNEIEAKVAAGEPVFVRFHDKRREGAVGKLTSVAFKENTYRRSYGSQHVQFSMTISEMVVEWDGRKNKVKPHSGEVIYLPDHPVETGTVWVWSPEATAKPKRDRVVVSDELGQEVEAGQIVCFVHRHYGRTALRFGTVSRMTDAGTVFVKTLKLKDNERSEEVRCYYDNLVIVNDKLMNRLTLAKLAAY